MMIIHGDNQTASRSYFQNLKSNSQAQGLSVLTPDIKDLDLPRLSAMLSSDSLFGQSSAVFLEGLFSKRESSAKNSLVSYLQSHPLAAIFIWEGSDMTSQLKSFSKDNIHKFDFPKALYTFLESLTLPHLQLSLKTLAPEIILASLSKHLSSLIMIADSAGNFPDWQRQKLARQSQKLGQAKIITASLGLLETDYRQKTSLTPLNLSSELELWCIKNIL